MKMKSREVNIAYTEDNPFPPNGLDRGPDRGAFAVSSILDVIRVWIIQDYEWLENSSQAGNMSAIRSRFFDWWEAKTRNSPEYEWKDV